MVSEGMGPQRAEDHFFPQPLVWHFIQTSRSFSSIRSSRTLCGNGNKQAAEWQLK